ncbi:S41 family peptidase [Desulfobacula phenolica]|uniref:Carboxyl-terminal processing protease n=1 Tax=Desulfobacula phenolica TaxID=90732 RepID=A0A1H2J1B7_9BACT|nr:S41 family peptidase [Desulfobacula phenolica]SDU50102.1 carboxyl-terminal processing protease [Desulfobacula phenolica]
MKTRSYKIFKFGFSVAIAACILISITGFNPSLQADDNTYKSLKLFTDVLEELEKNYVDDVNSEELIHNAIKGMVENLDPHSSFMPPEAFDELQDDTKGEFSGIGIVITMKDSILTVVSPIEGTPAYKAGIQAGDIIIKIDDKSTKGMALWEAVNMMRGPRHKTVMITVIRQDEPKSIEFSLKRDLIPMESVRSVMLEPGYGYLRITNFRMSTLDDIKNHMEELESKDSGLKGLVMDLRDNPGGLLDQAVQVSDLFLSQGNIVSIKGRQESNTQVFKAYPSDEDRDYPIVVLINGGSASASEIVAGALQDHSRALILGTTSFGKGSVQTVRPLKEGFGIKYTIARYYTPNGRSIQAKGIEPDIEVEYEILEKKEKKSSTFDRMIKEKDLKNSLKPEKIKKPEQNKKSKKTKQPEQTKKQNGKDQRLLDKDQLQHDAQIKRALDILISYGVFSKLNGS